jgi:peroxiredoxin
MARTPTVQIPLGYTAPDFLLPETVSGKMMHLSELKGQVASVVIFICNHCPFVIHVQDELVRVANDYSAKGVSFIAISSNDAVNYPQDGPDQMREHALKVGYPFPYLYDESQEVAKAYTAACTPDISVFDSSLRCVYRGQMDSSRPGNDVPVNGEDLRSALDKLLAGKEVSKEQTPSIGCNIKWRAGNEPDYFGRS